MDLSGILSRHARYRGDHVAVVFEDQRLTYAQFDRAVNRLANGLLQRGLRKGDKLATIMPNCLELLTMYWAAAKTGIVVVPMSPLLQASGVANLIADSQSTAVFAHASTSTLVADALTQLPAGRDCPHRFIACGRAEGFEAYDDLIAEASEAPPPEPGLDGEALFNIVYSSGTTGAPKGIMHNHRVRAHYAALFASTWRMSPESVVTHAGAIIFNGAFLTMMPAFYLGATFVLQRLFEPDSFIAAVERERITHVMLVPTQIVSLLDHAGFTPERVGSLEMALSVGAPLHLEHKKRLDALLPGRFYELYGITEGFVTVLDRDDVQEKPQSVGAPPAFSEVRVVDAQGNDQPPGEVGEIIGRGPIMMQGYYNRPDLTAEAIRDGWLYSGDLGYLDEDGYLHLVDRKKDMIISGGVNVYPRDIEEVGAEHGAVREIAVIGIPHPRWGETPLAIVSLKDEAGIDANALRDWINARVDAKFQRVFAVEIVEDFPRNAAGKVLKRDLREVYETRAQSDH